MYSYFQTLVSIKLGREKYNKRTNTKTYLLGLGYDAFEKALKRILTLKIFTLTIFNGLTLNIEFISRVRRHFLYFHWCEARVKI